MQDRNSIYTYNFLQICTDDRYSFKWLEKGLQYDLSNWEHVINQNLRGRVVTPSPPPSKLHLWKKISSADSGTLLHYMYLAAKKPLCFPNRWILSLNPRFVPNELKGFYMVFMFKLRYVIGLHLFIRTSHL